jgi:serine protease
MRPKDAICPRSPGISRSPIRPGLLASAFLAAAVLASTAIAQEYNPARRAPVESAESATQRLIVKFRASSGLSTLATNARESAVTSSAARVSAFASRTGLTLHSVREIGGDMSAVEVMPLVGETPVQTLARLNADSEIEFAVPDRKVYPHAVSNDPGALGQWYLAGEQPSAINAHGAWDITTGGPGVVIAVIDTGVRFDHPDLQPTSAGGKLLPGYDFVSGDPGGAFRTANDGDGRDPDASDPGDWVSPSDACGEVGGSSWHGTRVAGIIGAMTNNNLGVAGINWGGAVLPVRVLGKCGGYNSDVLAGIRWAAGLSVAGVPANPNPAKVINVSLGSMGACDPASANVIREVSDLGVLVVVSAGNEGGPVDSPANCPGAMAVLGLRHAGTKVGFSSLGPEIALGAPGGNCVNVTPGSPCLFSIDTTSNAGSTTPSANIYTNQINSNVGTSFSSPIVAGIAGLMLSVNGQLKGPDLIRRMKRAAKPFPTTSETTTRQCTLPSNGFLQIEECICNTSVCGAGMANALGSVLEAQRPVAVLSGPASVTQGVEFTLSAAGSAAANGRTLTEYSWSVDPGSTGSVTLGTTTGVTTTLQPPVSGFALVRLTVTDDVGARDVATVRVQPTSVSQVATDMTFVTIAATDANATEGGDVGVFTVTRTGSTSAALTVAYSLSGNAVMGTDYATLSGTVSIPAGQSTATITVTPIDDTSVEPNETVVATLQAGTGYEVSAPSTATVTIVDNDTASAPPPSDNGGGGGGGGAIDLLTLMGILVFLAHAVLRRREAVQRR